MISNHFFCAIKRCLALDRYANRHGVETAQRPRWDHQNATMKGDQADRNVRFYSFGEQTRREGPAHG